MNPQLAMQPWWRPRWADLCRLSPDVCDDIRHPASGSRLVRDALLAVVAGSALYGYAFGCWRSPAQAWISAAKMPLMILGVMLLSGAANGMLAKALGSGLTFRQTQRCILLSFAIAALALGALSPVGIFFSLQMTPPHSAGDMASYRLLLPLHSAVVGLCGIAGTLKLFRLLKTLVPGRALAARVLASWLCVSGLAGVELSWLASPFLARPDIPVPVFNPNAFRCNFFEYLWDAAHGRFRWNV